MEKFVERPRHIEFQVLADQYGNVASLGERECSIQRRHQKLLEESPSTQVSPELRDQIGKVLCKTLSDVGYVNAGTIEFLMDEDRKLYFIEMNTRIQVEHPVTEMVTDVDLVKSQILLAAGERLENVLHGPILHRGHAIECRINAEHPEKFTPSAGRITTFNPPGGTGVRIDTAAYAEGVIPPYYDSLIAKLIVRGKDRAEAVSRMAVPWRCSSSRAFSPRFRCTAEFWRIPISAPAILIRRSLKDFWRRARRRRPQRNIELWVTLFRWRCGCPTFRGFRKVGSRPKPRTFRHSSNPIEHVRPRSPRNPFLAKDARNGAPLLLSAYTERDVGYPALCHPRRLFLP